MNYDQLLTVNPCMRGWKVKLWIKITEWLGLSMLVDWKFCWNLRHKQDNVGSTPSDQDYPAIHE